MAGRLTYSTPGPGRHSLTIGDDFEIGRWHADFPVTRYVYGHPVPERCGRRTAHSGHLHDHAHLALDPRDAGP
jgi:hypothetical protein